MNILLFHRILKESYLVEEFKGDFFDSIISKIGKITFFLNFESLKDCSYEKEILTKKIIITFDDGYADNFLVAFPILEKYKVQSTFFISSGYLNGGWMWNDGIIEAVAKTNKSTLDLTCMDLDKYSLCTKAEKQACIADLLRKIKYQKTEKRTELAKRILDIAQVPEPVHLMMTDEQVKKMHQAGMEIGGHTVNHPILTSVEKSTARREIFENKEYLESLIGEPLRSFAYPNGKPGKDYGLEHIALVKEAGYKCAVSTAWGRVNKNSDPFQLPRFTPWDRNPWKFMLRLWLTPREKDGQLEC